MAVITCQVACKPGDSPDIHQVDYYPKRNVYFDRARNFYFYSVNGGKSWDSFEAVYDTDTLLLGKRVTVKSTRADFYRDNASHRKIYHGVAYTLYQPGEPAGSMALVTERKLPKKTVVTNESKDGEPEKRRGLKKFFSKIFGKKKKSEPSD